MTGHSSASPTIPHRRSAHIGRQIGTVGFAGSLTEDCVNLPERPFMAPSMRLPAVKFFPENLQDFETHSRRQPAGAKGSHGRRSVDLWALSDLWL